MKHIAWLGALLCCLSGSQRVDSHPGSAEAIDYLNAMIIAAPHNQELFRQRGVLYMHDEQFDLALADLQHAASLGDTRAVAFDLGVLQLLTDKPVAALASFDSCLEYLPRHSEARRKRAGLRRQLLDIDGALRDYRVLLGAPQIPNPADYLAAAQLMLESPRHNTQSAIAILDAGMARLGTVPQLQGRAIALELELKHYDAAIARLQALAPASGGNPFWHVELSQLLHAAGRTEQAISHLDNAEELLLESRKTPARLQLAQDLQALRNSWYQDQEQHFAD